jgi:site-specific DNA-cytosine methylase
MVNVLSVFDGISCMQVALQRSSVSVSDYYASEIDKYAIRVTQSNFPNTIQLGDVNDVDVDALPRIDILAGGSPCQDISGLNKRATGLIGKKSSLFFKFLDIRDALLNKNPGMFWLLENVSGNATQSISMYLGRRPCRLNSNIVSPQNRERLYWTNIPVNTVPVRKRLLLKSVLESDPPIDSYQNENWLRWWSENKEFQLSKGYSTLNAKRASCLTARMYASWNGNFIQDERGIRKLTRVECERLQTLPDNYTATIPINQAYKALGNCWTVDIVAHILSHLPQEYIMNYK